MMTGLVLRTAGATGGQSSSTGLETDDGRTQEGPRTRPAKQKGAFWGLLEGAALLGGLAWAGSATYGAWDAGQRSNTPVHGVRIAGVSVGGLGPDTLAETATEAAEAASDRALTLVGEGLTVETTARDLGASAETGRAVDVARAVGRSGSPLADLHARLAAAGGHVDLPIGYAFDESKALTELRALASKVETPSLPTRMDFSGRKVIPAQRGTALLAYDSLSAVATGLAAGDAEIALVVATKPPVDDPLGEVAADLDISVVLGSFDTPYRADEAHKDRSHNLKVGAGALDGYVLAPGETFSFNDTVGARSAENGYRYGTGISGGQLVDVLGGGICQVSSTLFGAGFFGGLEVVSARPHSRPSSYVDMGLDSTVVYPTVDMKVRNPYDFPVVLHMTVSSGKVHAEVLGPRRPYQIAFERSLDERLPYSTVWRDDARLRSGSTSMAQRGRRGFKLKRERKFLQSGEVVKTESWDLSYPPTTEIIRRGTNPAGEMPETKERPALRDPAPALKIVQ